jgi:hypothetical protein
MQVHFKTPTLLSHLDLVTMGGSEKINDEKKIGKFSSGLKIGMALALRNDVELSVKVFDSTYYDNFDRKRITHYSVSTFEEYCEQTGKEKEVLQINKDVNLQSYFSVHCEDLGGGDLETENIVTGFSTKLGVDWKLWMLLREIYSNMLDEGGEYSEQSYGDIDYGTIITLEFKEDSEFYNIWQNRHLYINEKEPLFKISNDVEVLENEENYLRIYKQNILVYEDKERPSRFAWNCKFGNIDERRILSEVYSVEQRIAENICNTSNKEFLKTIITPCFKTESKEFLNDNGGYYGASALMHEVALEVYEEFGEVNSYSWVMDKIKKRKDCKIAGKKITTVQDSLWGYSKEVTIDSKPNVIYNVNFS